MSQVSEGAPPPAEPSSFLTRRFWLRVLIGAVIVFGIKTWSWWFAGDGSAAEYMGVSGLYQTMLSQMARRQAASHTAVIEIDPADLPARYLGTNVCNQRLLLAELTTALAHSPDQPFAVAVDKFFGPATCNGSTEGEANTAALKSAMATAVGRRMGVIVGMRLREGEKIPHQPKARPAEPMLDLGKGVEHGVLNVAASTRQVPLLFSAVLPEAKAAELKPSLTWLAVQRKDPQGMAKMSDRFVPTDEEAPYISFLDQEVMRKHTFSAAAVLCELDAARAQALRLDCGKARTGFRPEYLRGRVAIIGEKTDADIHDSAIGSIHGYFLHANYIEAMLDGRYYFPMSGAFNFVSSVVLVMGIEFVLYESKRRGRGALFISIVSLGGCALFLLLEFAMAQALHWLVLPYASFFGLVVQSFERLLESVAEALYTGKKATG